MTTYTKINQLNNITHPGFWRSLRVGWVNNLKKGILHPICIQKEVEFSILLFLLCLYIIICSYFKQIIRQKGYMRYIGVVVRAEKTTKATTCLFIHGIDIHPTLKRNE
tara:strand:+ start:74 stop:397 length:324 start_codon:yes stop_codon:yes gene_type:complete